ncbi:tetratricopeptide repeat protein [Marivirga arenosa]|uniref:Tetratricopeptide repeat protein n=1 Tax=Marivirga arenosa TaxID=3059076 RepID=A0AA51ZXM8_9BACT|nr:tetratricopeptide repeat protein [Marivirga sp. BKB1-2]WNB18626.1 tetratricopeptide repeat protein [Marivirga sp. BKB1-2]
MKSVFFTISFFLLSISVLAIDPVGKIAKANAAKERAAEALKNGDYEKVIEHYTYLLDSLNYESPQAELNRAHAYFQLKDTVNSYDAYRRVADSDNKELKSKALLQLGNLSEMQKEYENALSFYKEALRADPGNQKARYNYELLKKKMQQQEQQNQDQQDQNKDQNDQQQDQENKDQENKDQQSKEDQNSENQKNEENQENKSEDQNSEEEQQKENAEQQQEGEQSEDEKSEQEKEQQQQQEQQKEGEQKENADDQKMDPATKQKLKEMNISEEKAQMILEALRNKESQYFQQLRKKATKKQDSGKPDW